ncbi:MAG: hypothetical protein UT06_C0008G0005 [Candidatus Woesebacteria bacterium GW2011_GWA1_38_8]|uniref:Uncharacterized protein n=1 Tax=Candidatus Woesebacteria bacterium GW2011_GWA1_38_8 TaxID=1618547 RepID=A0A0G0P4F6_9BACT|nr:MAG: hypothetical protein UT06_C0008G0005 [Candidatus Woesebacteria bacterium GW2011_GWA1_38_8]
MSTLDMRRFLFVAYCLTDESHSNPISLYLRIISPYQLSVKMIVTARYITKSIPASGLSKKEIISAMIAATICGTYFLINLLIL